MTTRNHRSAPRRLLLLGALLLASAVPGVQAQSVSPAGVTALNAPVVGLISPAQAAQAAAFIAKIKAALEQIQQVMKLKDALLDPSQWTTLLESTKMDLFKYTGLQNINFADLQAVYTQFKSLSSQIQGMQADITTKSNSLFQALTNTALSTGDITGAMVGLSPDMIVAQHQAGTAAAAANEKGKDVVKRKLETHAAMNNSVDSATSSGERAVGSQAEATRLNDAAQNAQSTREAAQVIGEGIATLVSDNALNNTAISAQLAQQAKQTEILNGAVETLVQDTIDQRTADAIAVAKKVDSDMHAAKQLGDTLGTVIATVSTAINSTTQPIDMSLGALY